MMVGRWLAGQMDEVKLTCSAAKNITEWTVHQVKSMIPFWVSTPTEQSLIPEFLFSIVFNWQFPSLTLQ